MDGQLEGQGSMTAGMECMDVLYEGWMGRMNGWADGCMTGWADGWMDECMDGQMVG